MDKIDFKRSLPSFRAKQGRFDFIEMPESQYLMIDGHGDPNTSSDFASALTMAGQHHEIYLSDVRRTAPEKLRTILRQPMIQQDHRG